MGSGDGTAPAVIPEQWITHHLESSGVASVASPIVTEGSEGQMKIRRGADWRGSHHHASTQTQGVLGIIQ